MGYTYRVTTIRKGLFMAILDDNDVFEGFLTNNVAEGAKFADLVHLINQKLALSTHEPAKIEVLSEVLNEIKLYLAPTSSEVH